MPQVAIVARVEEQRTRFHEGTESPPNDQSAALMTVAQRLLALAADPATQWSEIARISAKRCALEMLRQCGEPKP
jgi:hypothetical protein